MAAPVQIPIRTSAPGPVPCALHSAPYSPLQAALRPLCGAYAKDICDKIKVLDAGHIIVKLRVIRQIGQTALAFQRVLPHGNAVHINFSGIKLLDTAAAF